MSLASAERSRERAHARYLTMFAALAAAAILVPALAGAQVKTTAGIVKGSTTGGAKSIRTFLGIPYAKPPVGDMRWRAPEPPASWSGERDATKFGPRCMQAPIYSDMIFRDTNSEDCLYLNVWTPAKAANEKLPVMVWIYGGGFQAGSASEPRQDGERLAGKGVVVVSMNYRMGVFGFYANPELTAESSHHSSGNYGLLDQTAAIRWVHDNIAAFGGDPNNVTIFGESAGSFSVSAQMASPLNKGMVQKAIGESGAFFSATLAAPTLSSAEERGKALLTRTGVSTVAQLRAIPGDSLLKIVTTTQGMSFSPIIDGYFLPRPVPEIYAAGDQLHIPLLAGWNAGEVRGMATLAAVLPTAESFTQRVKAQFGENADAVLAAYPAATDSAAVEAMAALSSDQFISHGTWRWLEAHRKSAGQPVYRYLFAREIPIPPGQMANGRPITAHDVGARHAGEIEYVFGALNSVPKVTWEPADRALSDLMMSYWSNFAKTGNPNGAGLPTWPRYESSTGNPVMTLDVKSGAAPDRTRARYEVLEKALARKP